MCGLTVISGGNPAEGMGDSFHLHCQTVEVDTVYLRGWCLHLA